MLDELIARVFATRNCVHLAHWSTNSGYHHEVLGTLYSDLISNLDSIVEAHMGNFNQVPKPTLKDKSGDVAKCLEADAVWIAENRSKIAGGVEAIENLVDSLTETYLSAIFKLNRLR